MIEVSGKLEDGENIQINESELITLERLTFSYSIIRVIDVNFIMMPKPRVKIVKVFVRYRLLRPTG